MGLFELFKKQGNSFYEEPRDSGEVGRVAQNEPGDNLQEEITAELDEHTGNAPRILTAKLFFQALPEIHSHLLLAELQKKYPAAQVSTGANSLIFSVPANTPGSENDIFEGCLLTTPTMQMANLPKEAYKQNWHWKEAGTAIQNCAYEVLLTEKQIGTLAYKERTEVFIDFVIASIEVLRPDVIYSKNAEKLLEPRDVLGCRSVSDPDILHPFTNIRMFKVADSEQGEILMDTIGLDSLGLPDLEIIFHNQNPAKIAELLLRYCYFIYDIGDVVQHGEYLEGLNPGERWKCERRKAMLDPERVVLHVSVA